MHADQRVSPAVLATIWTVTTMLCLAATGTGAFDLQALKDQLPAADKDGKLTGPSREIMTEIGDTIFAEGRAGVEAIVEAVNVLSEKDNDYRPRYIVHALVTRAAGKPAERKLLVSVMSEYIQGEAPVGAREYVVQQLQVIGSDDAVQALGTLLGHSELCDAACQALMVIGTDAAVAELLKALPGVSGPKKCAVIQALGKIGDSQAVPPLLTLAGADDEAVRIAAIEALGAIGDAAATETLLAAAPREQGFALSLAGNACLELAENLSRTHKKDEALRIYRTLLAGTTNTGPHIRGAALYNLAATVGAEAIPDVLTALNDTDNQVHKMAVQAGVTMSGDDDTQQWVQKMGAKDPRVRAGVILIIGGRGGPLALQPVLSALKDSEAGVRLAAISAATLLGKGELVFPLLQIAAGGEPEDADAKRALLRMPSGEADKALILIATSGDTALRVSAIDIIAERKSYEAQPALLTALDDKDNNIREAALNALREMGDGNALQAVLAYFVKTDDTDGRKRAEAAALGICKREKERAFDKVLHALEGTNGGVKAALVRMLGPVGGRKALSVVVASVADPNAEVKDAAVRTLAAWTDASAIQPLLEIVVAADSEVHHVLALRACLRLVAADKSDSPEKVERISTILAAARRADEKKLALSTLAELDHPAALKSAETYLKDPDLKGEAELAVFKIAERTQETDPVETRRALERLIVLGEKEQTKERAAKLLQKIPPQ